jgi:type I restriction enzyme R subunit
LEKRYTYIRFLLNKIPRGDRGPIYNFDDDVALKYYRLQKISEGSIHLEPGKSETISGPTEVGTGVVRGDEIELSRLIDILNDRFGTEFTSGDQLFFDSIREDAVGDEKIRQSALVNSLENFGIGFKKSLMYLIMNRMDQNQEIAAKFMNEDAFQEAVSAYLLKDVYEKIRSQINNNV